MENKKLTPMMELIEEINYSIYNEKEVIDNASEYHPLDVKQATLIYNTSMNIVKKIENKLEKERQMIIDAYNYATLFHTEIDAEQYYNETFKTK